MESIFTEYISPFILAILQGIAEFLPISSSGHLVLLSQIMSTDTGLLFDLILHLATLISVVAFYRRDIISICAGCFQEIRSSAPKTNLKFVGYLIIATIITGIMGICLKGFVENQLRTLIFVGPALILNAIILYFSQKKGVFKLSNGDLNLKTSLLIGLTQGIAVLPGISRSGSTITAALLMGIRSQDCAKISFLLSIPAILGAIVLEIPHMSSMQTDNLVVILLASVVASIVGYISLVLLDKILKNAKLHHFSPYCLIVGIIAISAYFIL